MKTRETILRKSLLAASNKLKYFYCKKDHIDMININDRTINYKAVKLLNDKETTDELNTSIFSSHNGTVLSTC